MDVEFPKLKLLKPGEVAELLQVSVDTLAVWRCVHRYNLRFVKIGHAIRYREEDVHKFIEEQSR